MTDLPELPRWYDYDPETGSGNPSTPLRASTLNGYSDAVRSLLVEAVDRTEDAAADAEAAASSTTDTNVAAIVANAASTTRGTLDGVYDPISGYGTYSTRPTASAVRPGTLFYASDTLEVYRSNGTSWSPVGAGGNELGYASTTTVYTTTSTSPSDVPGLTTTFVAPERPVKLILRADMTASTASTYAVAYLMVGSTYYGRARRPALTPAALWQSTHREIRVSGLTAGTTYTAKVQLGIEGAAGTAYIAGETGTSPVTFTNPMSLSVVTS